MLNIPVMRWGEPYESLEIDEVLHFATGEPIAKVSQANGGIIQRDMRKAQQARDTLRQFKISELIAMIAKAADLYENGTLPLGDGVQSPDDFVHQQSASTGLPEHMCRSNMGKNSFVLKNMDRILDCLTRGLDLDILTKGYGMESRGVMLSYQAQAPVLGAVLPSNSPGVHTLWLPVIPLQLGLVLKPGPQEPWTPYRMISAFIEAGIPRNVFSLYPGGPEAGAAVLSSCDRAMIFGGTATVEQYKGNHKVQAHGPGFSKILLGDDVVDDWEKYIDLMAESIYINSGRGCINCSGVWASRHTQEIAQALAEKLGPIEAKPPQDEEAGLAAFTISGMGKAVWNMIETDLKESGVTDMTSQYGDRLVEQERCSYLRPTIVHCKRPENAIAKKEYMYPFSTVVECPQDQMLSKIGPTLVCTAITDNQKWAQELSDATHIDRLNIGPIPTTRLNWLQPHEGSIIDFLFRSRAYQVPE
ncbi:aldehyde dehydrogenase family protein [Lignipirellula cremea]|uniref:aldehyde dehydrogenase family protein n=1 Tax=Lignipirellula cremea TaxID=2528010 RepID=UPI00119C9EA8|nr:aldehyde dehydrogenase family protein [Lignipirellula cremea]